MVGRLKRRPEFLAVAGTRRKHVAPGLILQVRRHDERQRPADGEPPLRFGLTASRKVGNAVVRNRARRRLREAAGMILPAHAAPGHDFVLVARSGTAERPWPDLLGDLTAALKRLGLWRDAPAPAKTAPADATPETHREAREGAEGEAGA
ncbi:ribonuclease P protein component [Azospirillum sp. SYSU D00513]|uniref:ribonuclease P protein component n=1 Tax=Azospirillum sp. SYSU D00513 TaxID=2812561 RepID=UPI001FFE403C|nr:ribonuclease P protein component [Azospirillum sp. SYSU D00513]